MLKCILFFDYFLIHNLILFDYCDNKIMVIMIDSPGVLKIVVVSCTTMIIFYIITVQYQNKEMDIGTI